MKLQIKIDGKTYEAEVEILDETPTPENYPPYPPVFSTAQPMHTTGAYAPAHAAVVHTANEKEYASPVTGLVIKVSVAVGQEIELGDTIVVLEAMKMETTVTAHQAGRVKSVLVAQGDPVKAHQVLVEME